MILNRSSRYRGRIDHLIPRIERHLHRGDVDKLDSQIESFLERITDDSFEDGFKGVFRQEELPTDAVEELTSFRTEQRAQLG